MPTKPQNNYKPGSSKDDLDTPGYALGPLLEFLPKEWRVWEPAVGKGYLARSLMHFGYQTITTGYMSSDAPEPDQDYFHLSINAKIEYDVQVTNVPFSLKLPWLERAFQNGKPFAILVQDDTLATGGFQKTVLDVHPQPGIIWFSPRISFRTPNKVLVPGEGWAWTEDNPERKNFGKLVRSSAQFGCIWITWKLGFTGNMFRPQKHWTTSYRKAWENWHEGFGGQKEPPDNREVSRTSRP